VNILFHGVSCGRNVTRHSRPIPANESFGNLRLD
jgi:hypothetical protein